MHYQSLGLISLLIAFFLQTTLEWQIVSQEFRQTSVSTFGLTGWQLNGNALTTSNVIEECQTTLIKIEQGQTLTKQFSVSYFEFSSIRVEMNAYFYDVVDSYIELDIAGNSIIQQVIVSSTTPSNIICNNNAPSLQYLLNFFIICSQQTFDIVLKFDFAGTPSAGVFLGIRDLIIFTDSVAGLNGCPLELPILSTTQVCVNKCNSVGEQLSGHYLNKCIVPDDTSNVLVSTLEFIEQSGIIKDPDYLGTNVQYYRLTAFTSTFPGDIFIYPSFLTDSDTILQLQGTLYLINWAGENQININYNYFWKIFSIITANTITQSMPEKQIQDCTITMNDNSKTPAKALEINSEIFIGDVSGYGIVLSQILSSNLETYAFLNLNYYYAKGIKHCASLISETYCISCFSPYWAYRGQCDNSCPYYTKLDYENRKCIDLSEYETLFNLPNILINAHGYYLTKISQDDLTLSSNEISLKFSSFPSSYNNYQNSQKYTLLPNLKLVGGFNSWGYGSFTTSYASLPTHFQIRIFVDLYLFDDWTLLDEFKIFVDGVLIDTVTISGIEGQHIYGLPRKDYFSSLFYRVQHINPNLSIDFQCRGIAQDASFASCGITNLFILYDVNIKTLCLSNEFYSFITNKCEICHSACTSGCQLESTNCDSCHYSCQLCTGPSDLECSDSCTSAHHRILSGTECHCITNYTEEIGIEMCTTQIGCHYSCQSCYKINDPNSCSTCPSQSTTHRIQGNNLNCVCENGYEDAGIQTCSIQYICHVSCDTCILNNSSSSCLTCSTNSISHRTINSSTKRCLCDSGYQETSPNSSNCYQISPCHISCVLCSAINSSTSCLTCPSNSTSHRTYNLLTNTCSCDSGYQEDSPISQNCIPQPSSCHLSCNTCSLINSSTNCLSCPPNLSSHRTYNSLNNTCSCDINYTEANPIQIDCVIQCHKTCESCTIANLETDCTSCGDNAITHRTLSPTNTCPCDPGYEEQTPLESNCITISPCHYSCQVCSAINDPNSCLSCPTNGNSHRTLNANMCLCNYGYVDIANQQNCIIQCHHTCQTCLVPNSSNFCDSCINSTISHRVYNSSTHTCNCDIGYTEDGTNPNCKMICHYTCQTCSSPLNLNSCLTCDNTMNRIQGSSSDCPCNAGYEDVLTSAFCTVISSCHQTCLMCSAINSSDSCVSCFPSQFRELNATGNECICMNGYIDQPGDPVCLIQCHYTCDTCSIPNSAIGCLTCPSNALTHRIVGPSNNCICQSGYVETNQIICQLQCHYSCDTCSSSYDQNACISCNISAHRIQVDQSCACQDGYIEVIGQQNCSIVCHSTCLTCSQSYLINKCLDCPSHRELDSLNQCICKQGYSEVNQPDCEPICHQKCLTCYDILDVNCLSCDSQLNRILKDNQCICDDRFIEAVDDPSLCICQNDYYFDNNQCLNCSESCLTCSQFDQCTSCSLDSPKELKDHQCVCKQQYWMKEIDSDCISCDEDDGWLNEQCIKRNCGDGLFTYGEQCDDGNDDPRDGCDHCVRIQGYTCNNEPLQHSVCFKCADRCKECLLDGQCILCDEGSQLQNGNCQKCQDNCSVCKESQCFKCQVVPKFISQFLSQDQQRECPLCADIDGLYTNSDGTDCVAKCGDQIMVANAGEQCDDGNNIDFDGCSSTCQLELGFQCQGTQCIADHPPVPILSEILPSDCFLNKRLFQLSYDTLLMEYVNVTNHLSFQIGKKVVGKDYKISLIETTKNPYELTITLELFSSFIEDKFQIVFENHEQIIGNNGLSQVDEIISVDISDFEFVSENTKQATKQISSVNEYILYVLFGLICLAILLGGMDAFWNLLDLIQILSYIQFIDTRYPYNLSKFLELFEFGQLKFLDDLIKVQSLIAISFDQAELESYQPKGIFGNYIDSSLFIINIQSTVTAFLLVLALYIASSFLIKVLTKISNYFHKRSVLQYKTSFELFLQLKTLIFGFIGKFEQQFFWNGLIRTHMSTAYDISFAILLQLQYRYVDMKSSVAQGNYILCCITIVLQIIVVLVYTSKLDIQVNQFKQIEFKNNFGQSIFESLEVKQLGKLKTYYNVFLLIKRFMHILFLIYFYRVPSIQTTFIGLIQITQIVFLILSKPLKEKVEHIKQLQCEILLYILHFKIFIFTIDDQIHMLSENGRILIGWFCIGDITLMMITQLLMDIIQQTKHLSNKFKRIYQKFIIESNNEQIIQQSKQQDSNINEMLSA